MCGSAVSGINRRPISTFNFFVTSTVKLICGYYTAFVHAIRNTVHPSVAYSNIIVRPDEIQENV